jgi:hypothetical protein
MVMMMSFELEGCYIQKVSLAFNVPWRELLKRSEVTMILLFTGYLQLTYMFFFPFYLTVLKFLTILPHVLFFLQLLVSYGDNGTKGALSDDDVLSSAKCQVQYNKLLFIPFNMFV